MRVKFFSTCLFACFAASSSLCFAVNPEKKADDCGPNLDGTTNAVPETKTLKITELPPFEIGGEGWARTFLTSKGQALIGIVNPMGSPRVFDLFTGVAIPTGLPADSIAKLTRGEWDERNGEPIIHMGDYAGTMHHVGVGPQPSYDAQSVGENTPVVPLAVTDDGVLAGMPAWGRVRIMPNPPRALEDQIEIQVPSFVRASERKINGRDLVATVSDGKVSVVDRSMNAVSPVWERPLETSGRDATVTLFKTETGDPALALIDGSICTVFKPFDPTFTTQRLPLAGVTRAKYRVRALSTGETTFIEAPGTKGSNLYKFEGGLLKFWAKLPKRVSNRQKAIFLAPDRMVYVAWVEPGKDGRDTLLVGMIRRREMITPIYRRVLAPGEIISDSQAMDLTPPNRLVLTFRTSERVLPILLEL